MPRARRHPRQRLSLIARIALAAWLVFVVVASVGPFLIHAGFITIIGDPTTSQTIDVFVDDGSIDILGPGWRGLINGYDYAPYFQWRPSAREWITFDRFGWPWERLFWSIEFPPWTVLLVPTLLVFTAHRVLRYRARRKPTKLGRTPCPACGYDATGLSACPECGTEMERPTQPAP